MMRNTYQTLVVQTKFYILFHMRFQNIIQRTYIFPNTIIPKFTFANFIHKLKILFNLLERITIKKQSLFTNLKDR